MNQLALLMAQRKAAAQAGGQPNVPIREPVVQTGVGAAGPVPQPEKVASPAEAGSQPAAKPSNPFAARFAQRQPEIVAHEPEAIDDSEMDLSDLSESEEGEAEPKVVYHSPFPDETPATAPSREIPADAEKGVLQFIQLIDGVYAVVDDAEMLGNVIRSIMVELKANPQYMKQVTKVDIRTWVRAMRDSMGLARIKKQEKAQKRTPGGAKGKSKVLDKDMEDAFADLGVDLANL